MMAHQPPTAEDAAKWPGLIVPPSGSDVAPPVPPDTPQNWPGLIPSSAPAPGQPSYSLLGVPLGFGPDAVEALRQGTSAAVQGVAAVPGLLYDAAATPQNLLAEATGQDWLRAAPAREQVGKILGAAGLPPEATPTLAHRVIENTAATVPTLALGPAVAALAKAAPTVATVLRPAGEALSQAPVAQLVGGVGAGAAQEIADASTTNPLIRGVAPVLGGLAGAGSVEGIAAAARNLLDPSRLPTRMALTALARRSTSPAKTVKDLLDYTPSGKVGEVDVNASPGASLLSADGRPLPEPDFTAALTQTDPVAMMRSLRTTAETLNDPGVYGLENDLRNFDRSQAGAFMQDAAKRQEARVGALDELAPRGGADASTVTDVLGQQRDQATALDQALLQGQQQALEGARVTLGPAGMVENTGPVLQSAFDRLKGESGADVGALRAAVDPGNTTAIPRSSVVKPLQQSAARLFGDSPDLWPSAVKNELARLPAQPGVPFNLLQDMRSGALAEMQGLPSAASGAGKLRLFYGDMQSAIHDAIEQAAESGQGFSSEQLDAWNAFRDAARVHGARFGDDVGSKLSQSTYGRPDTGQARVPGMYFAPGPTGADRMGEFLNTFTDPATGQLDPAAKAAMQQHVAGQVGTLFDPTTGAPIKTADLSRFVGERNYGPALRVAANNGLPELRQGVSSVDAAVQSVASTRAQVAGNLADYQKSVASHWLGADAGQAIQTVLSGTNKARKMAQLTTALRDSPDGLTGLKRAYLDEMGRQSLLPSPMGIGDARGVSQRGAQEFWDATQEAARVLFTPEEMRRIQAVNDNLSSQVAHRAWPGTGSMTASNQSNLTLLKNALLGQVPGTAKTAATEAMFEAPLVGPMIKAIAHMSLQRGIGQLYQLALSPEAAAMAMRQQSPETLERLARLTTPDQPTPLGTLLRRNAAGVNNLVPSPATVAGYAAARVPGAIAEQEGDRRPLVVHQAATGGR